MYLRTSSRFFEHRNKIGSSKSSKCVLWTHYQKLFWFVKARLLAEILSWWQFRHAYVDCDVPRPEYA